MRRPLPVLLLAGLFAFVGSPFHPALSAAPAPVTEPAGRREFSPAELAQGYRSDRVLVRLRPGTSAIEADAAEARAGIRDRRQLRALRDQRILELSVDESVPATLARLRATGLYDIVEPDYLRGIAATPNDPRFAEQWALNNLGQSAGQPDADIDAPEAWDLRTDASNVIVAVIDSGVRLTHADLAANLWRNPREIAGNARDDDGNGYIDDVHGIDATVARGSANSGNPTDVNGHGTHVAGTIGAVGNNGVGVAGVAWRVQLMALRFLGSNGRGSLSDAIECIDYAIANGAHIINASYGVIGDETTDGFSQSELAAIRRARDAGILFVAAAGNSARNLDLAGAYPASYLLDNIVAVGASTRLEDIATFSNTGSGMVELFAPGSDVLSLGQSSNTAYATLSGTSMAAPHVSGALALLKAQFPADTPRQLVNRLLRAVDPHPRFLGRVQTGGRLNLARALASTSNRPFNDDFAARAQLRGGSIAVRTSNTGATAEAGEPAHAGLAPASTLWWSWVAPGSGTVTVDTGRTSGLDTRIAVYTGSTVNALSLVAANNNHGSLATSRLTFTAQANATYHLAIDTAGATGVIAFDLGAVPANDAFANATLLPEANPLVSDSNGTASAEAGEPAHAGLPASRSLWYRWTAPTSGTYAASAVSDQLDLVIAVYTGTSVNNLTPVAANDDTGIDNANTDARATFTATAGTTYSIAVDSKGEGRGEFTLTLTDSLWQVTTGDSLTSAPAVGPDGTLYAPSNDGHLYAVAPDGSLRWRYTFEGISDSGAAVVAPDGTIYFGTSTGTLHAVRADGTARWTADLDTAIYNAPALAADGTVYVKADAGSLGTAYLHALNPADGTRRWRYPTGPENTYAAPAVGLDGTIYVAGGDSAMHAVDPATGDRRWRTTLDSLIFTSPALDEAGNLYIATINGTAYSLSPTGAERWRRTVGGNVSSSLALADGRAYFAAYDAKLYALDQSTGALIWTGDLGDEVRASSPAVAADGSVVVGAYDGRIYHFNADGSLRRTWATGDWIRSSPALADGRLYIGSNDNKLYAFDLGLLSADATTAPWPQHRHNPHRTARAGDPANDPATSTGDVRLINLSARSLHGTGYRTPIIGVVLAGGEAGATAPMLLRAAGPALASLNVASPLPDPQLALFAGPVVVDRNDDWDGEATAQAAAASGAFAFASGSADAALLADLPATLYTVNIRSGGADEGVVLAEAYALAAAPEAPRLVNLSARAVVEPGENVLVAGFVLDGEGSRRLLLRAVGPGLARLGVGDLLANPELLLFDADGRLIATNDDWVDTSAVRQTFAEAGAFELTAGSKDAVLIRTLPAGLYTAQVRGIDGTSGVALIEIYTLP